ncbi:hypothetical protein M9434_000791 [Picochlorum sp. BPE23]|nr:hypothetical protein M9434_000791 [Picochlorum sp. BPE23]
MSDPRIQRISDAIRVIPDFPKPGILFQDVTTILLDPQAFQDSIDIMAEKYASEGVDVIAGFEARGLIFGAPLALALNIPFVPLRKPGKLPGETISATYETEYSTDKIEMHTGAVKEGQKVLLVDDLIATGGTLGAGIDLITKAKANVMGCACIIELPELEGRKKLGDIPLFVLVEKEDMAS